MLVSWDFRTFAAQLRLKPMKRALLLTTIYLFLSVLTAYGQRQSTVRTFSVRDGLPANSITSVRQDHRGLIWIATWNGLCCYDGYQFTTFRGEPWSDNALSTNRLSAIEPDSADNTNSSPTYRGYSNLDGYRDDLVISR